MKILFYLFACLSMLLFSHAFAQNSNSRGAQAKSERNEEAFAEKLVLLALKNHPTHKLLRKNVDIASLNVKINKWEWLDQFRAIGNLNEFTIAPIEGVNPFFPRYNFQLIVPMGIFTRTNANIKIAKIEREQVFIEMDHNELMVRATVLKLFQDYLMHEKVFQLKSDLVEDEYSNLLSLEVKFQNGDATLEEFREASRSYSLELENQIMVKNRWENVRLELEMWIGMPMDQVN